MMSLQFTQVSNLIPKVLTFTCRLKDTGWGLEYTANAVFSKPMCSCSAAVAFSHKHSLPAVPSGLPTRRIKFVEFYSRHTPRAARHFEKLVMV